MEYYTIYFIFLYLIIKSCEVSAITRRIDNQPVRTFRRHTGPPPFTDWELGLRESVYQALLKDHHADPSLREELLEAPLLGRQNTATPFGDIAVLARGQLYITAEGFKFVQDSDQNDCNDCHNPRCLESHQCRIWQSLGHHHKLLALWTVKRIRHRDPSYGHVYEIEYTISPITPLSEELIRRHGYFNYNIPGHIFVIKSNPRATANYYLKDDKWYKNQAQAIEPNREQGSGHFKPGILIGVGPDGYKHVLHSFPGFYSSYHPQHHENDQTTIDPKEYELYKKLIESLASKTSKIPHRFSVTTPTDKTSGVTTKPSYHLTTTFVPQTTYIQVTNGQLVPLTENTLQPTTQLVTPIKFPITSTKYSEPDLFYQPLPTTKIPTTPYIPTTKIPTNQYIPTTQYIPTSGASKPITVPATTIHYYTPVEATTQTTKTTTRKTKPKTTYQSIDTFDIFTTTPLSKTTSKTRTTSQRTTLPITTEVEQFEVFPIVTSTEPMQAVTENPVKTSPDSINEQLPPPDKDIDTTIPYGVTTVTQPTSIKTQTITTPATQTIKSTTQKFTTYVSTPRTELTTAIEKIPYTEEKTTVILPISTTQNERITTPIRQEKSTTIPFKTDRETSTIATTIQETSTFKEPKTSTIFNQETTPRFTIITETLPSTYVSPTTLRTTVFNKPTTIYTFDFDSTTKSFSTPVSTINTLPSTTSEFPSTEPLKITIPTTTTHFYYTYETDLPKTSTITTVDGVSTSSTQGETPTTSYTTQTTPETTITRQTMRPTTATKKYKTPKVSSTTSSDFLVDTYNGKRKNQIINTKQDLNEDDIFGKSPIKTTTHSPETTRRVLQSDIDKALFGGRRSKQLRLSSKITRRPQVNTTSIIYSNFFTQSTQIPTTQIKMDDASNRIESTTEFKPSTDQSLSTSITFEVNRRNRGKSTSLQLEPTIKADLKEIHNNNRKYRIYKAEIPTSTTEKTTTEKTINETQKVFDDIALSLVNHARSIDYLNKRPSRQPKYRRRNLVSRRRTVKRVNTNGTKNLNN